MSKEEICKVCGAVLRGKRDFGWCEIWRARGEVVRENGTIRYIDRGWAEVERLITCAYCGAVLRVVKFKPRGS